MQAKDNLFSTLCCDSIQRTLNTSPPTLYGNEEQAETVTETFETLDKAISHLKNMQAVPILTVVSAAYFKRFATSLAAAMSANTVKCIPNAA